MVTTTLVPVTATYRRGQRLLACVLAFGTLLLIIAGALVTSNDAGLAVPDWPTSFGSLYKLPPMVGGVLYEHGHRMLAQFIGLLTICMAIVTGRVDKRSWMRKLAWSALALVVAQGVLGGLTVLFYLPWWISTAHATMGQTFFCVVVLMAVFTSRSWIASSAQVISEPPGIFGLRTLTLLTATSIWCQLILGAAFRHSGMKLLPHLIGAAVVTAMILWTVTRVLSHHAAVPGLRRPALVLMVGLIIQLALGFTAYLTRVEWGADAVQPGAMMVLSTVSHVAAGALLLAASVVLAAQAIRHSSVSPVPARFAAQQVSA